jgi:hypothetical protein
MCPCVAVAVLYKDCFLVAVVVVVVVGGYVFGGVGGVVVVMVVGVVEPVCGLLRLLAQRYVAVGPGTFVYCCRCRRCRRLVDVTEIAKIVAM